MRKIIRSFDPHKKIKINNILHKIFLLFFFILGLIPTFNFLNNVIDLLLYLDELKSNGEVFLIIELSSLQNVRIMLSALTAYLILLWASFLYLVLNKQKTGFRYNRIFLPQEHIVDKYIVPAEIIERYKFSRYTTLIMIAGLWWFIAILSLSLHDYISDRKWSFFDEIFDIVVLILYPLILLIITSYINFAYLWPKYRSCKFNAINIAKVEYKNCISKLRKNYQGTFKLDIEDIKLDAIIAKSQLSELQKMPTFPLDFRFSFTVSFLIGLTNLFLSIIVDIV